MNNTNENPIIKLHFSFNNNTFSVNIRGGLLLCQNNMECLVKQRPL